MLRSDQELGQLPMYTSLALSLFPPHFSFVLSLYIDQLSLPPHAPALNPPPTPIARYSPHPSPAAQQGLASISQAQ